MISNSIKFFAAFGKTDYFRGGEEGLNKLGFWNFFSSEGIKPYGYLFSLAYRYAIFPDPNICDLKFDFAAAAKSGLKNTPAKSGLKT